MPCASRVRYHFPLPRTRPTAIPSIANAVVLDLFQFLLHLVGCLEELRVQLLGGGLDFRGDRRVAPHRLGDRVEIHDHGPWRALATDEPQTQSHPRKMI